MNARQGAVDCAVIERDGRINHSVGTTQFMFKYQEEYNKQQLQRLQRRSTRGGIRS
jgi:hypothetical protein